MRKYPRSWYVPNTYKGLVEAENTRGRVIDIIFKSIGKKIDIIEIGKSRGGLIECAHPRAEQIRRIAKYYSLIIEDGYCNEAGEEGFLLYDVLTPEWRFQECIRRERALP